MLDATEIFDFGEWLPDLGTLNNPGALEIKNCISESNIYRPFKQFNAFSNALADECRGAFAFRDAAGNVTIFAASRTKIYKLSGTSWSDVTRTSGGDYTTAADGWWEFVNFGNLVIATNYNDDIQVFDISTDTNFSQLSSTAPRCRSLFILSNFLVCVDIADGDGATGYRVRWSPLADPEGDWSDVTLQADFQDLYGGDYANVSGAVIQDVGYIIQPKSIWRMEFVGGDEIFRFELVEPEKGSFIGRSVISNGRNIFYIGEDGFYAFDGVASRPIGDNKVDKWFFENFDPTYDYFVNAAVDPINKLILWAFSSPNANGGTPDLIIAYNWADDRFTYIEEETQILFKYLSVGYTLEQLDTISTDIDALPFSLDSRNWTGGKTIFGAFNGSNVLGAFEGDPKTANIITKEVRPNLSGRATLHSVIPYIEGTGTIRARLGTRELMSQAVSYTAYTSINSMTGEFDFLKDLKFVRMDLEMSSTWTKALGFSLRVDESGSN